jgi:hypothetical protein
MIAANYLKHPEALRFQRELFHNGFKNSPRIMRLMECVFKFAPDVPQWAKDMARKARQLVKLWTAAQVTFNFTRSDKGQIVRAGFYVHPLGGQTWSGRGLVPKWLRECCVGGESRERYRLAVDTFIPWAM